MARSAILTLALGLSGLISPEALALGGDYPKAKLAEQGPNCVHGYFVNWVDVFFYSGDTATFNTFVAGYSQRTDLKLRVVIHAGAKKARSPWDKADRDIAADWSYYVWNVGIPDPRKPAPSRVDVWLGSRIKLDELRIPANVEVVSGGEIERFIEKRGLPNGLHDEEELRNELEDALK
jgi:hypothetical protein